MITFLPKLLCKNMFLKCCCCKSMTFKLTDSYHWVQKNVVITLKNVSIQIIRLSQYCFSEPKIKPSEGKHLSLTTRMCPPFCLNPFGQGYAEVPPLIFSPRNGIENKLDLHDKYDDTGIHRIISLKHKHHQSLISRYIEHLRAMYNLPGCKMLCRICPT